MDKFNYFLFVFQFSCLDKKRNLELLPSFQQKTQTIRLAAKLSLLINHRLSWTNKLLLDYGCYVGQYLIMCWYFLDKFWLCI